MNTGTFAGYVGRDAELKVLPSGDKVLNFSLGVTIGFGEKKETLWVGCAMWGERGEKLGQYIVKGMPLTVSGDVTVRPYMGRDNLPRAELVCNVQRLTMQGKASVERPAAEQASHAQATASAPAAGFNDEIPFN